MAKAGYNVQPFSTKVKDITFQTDHLDEKAAETSMFCLGNIKNKKPNNITESLNSSYLNVIFTAKYILFEQIP